MIIHIRAGTQRLATGDGVTHGFTTSLGKQYLQGRNTSGEGRPAHNGASLSFTK